MEYNVTSFAANCSFFDDQTNFTLNFADNDIPIFQVALKEKLYPISTFWTVALFIAYASIVLIGLVGNGLVLWLVLGSARMRTVTNTYICNLALADIIISLFTVPFHFQAALLQRWDIPHFFCPIGPFSQELSVEVSVFTLIAIALQRYEAVKHPLQISTAKWTPSIVVALIWITGICISIPTLVDFRVKIYHNADFTITPFCKSQHLSTSFKWFYYQFLVLVQYILPLIIISLAYRKTSQQLWSEVTPGIGEQNRDAVILNKKKKVTKMMVIVVGIFAICWLPYQVYNLVQVYFRSVNDFYYINIIWMWIHWLAMSNSCVNPFIYAILNEKFQEEFKIRWRQRRGNDSVEASNIIDENIEMVVQNVQILELPVGPQDPQLIGGLEDEMIPANVGSL